MVGVIGANKAEHLPLHKITLAERFKLQGYSTAIFGKWHLGNHPAVWPLAQGFDEWEGTVGSNDMGKGKPSLEARRNGIAGVEWIRGTQVIEVNPDQHFLTKRTFQLANDFITRKKDQPFFLYLPLNMPHTPLFCAPQSEGASKQGIYGDVIQEIDASIGKLLSTLQSFEIRETTLIAFTSDNGPWLIFGNHGGSNGGLAGGKKQTLEGGMRVPLVLNGSRVPAGKTYSTPCSGLDLGPTLISLAGLPWNDECEIDGIDLTKQWNALSSEGTPERAFYYFYNRELRAIRHGSWKLQFPTRTHSFQTHKKSATEENEAPFIPSRDLSPSFI